jgi:hypothetical protein
METKKAEITISFEALKDMTIGDIIQIEKNIKTMPDNRVATELQDIMQENIIMNNNLIVPMRCFINKTGKGLNIPRYRGEK